MSTKDRIIKTADRMFYEQGFENTSFADIAGAVGISRGNFYYHFKTKDEILSAVIAVRLNDRRTMLSQWEMEADNPLGNIRKFIDILIVNGERIKHFGCPIGTLSSELAKLDHPAQQDANALFTLFRDWLSRQFDALGCTTNADSLALHLLARSQGVATLANAFRDDEFIRQEVNGMVQWVKAQCPADSSSQTA